MAKALIVVPTKGRIDKVGKHTLSWLINAPFDWILLVEPQEADLFRYFYKENVISHLLVLPKNDMGLGYALKFIKNYAITKGYDLVWKIDDDISAWGEWFNEEKRGTKARQHSAATFIRLVNDGIAIFESNPSVGAISYPYRNELFKYGCTLDKRLQTAYAIRPELWEILEDRGNFEDFIASIGVWKSGHSILRYGHVGIDGLDVGKTPGGFQCFERGNSSRITLEKLQVYWPDIVTRRVENRQWKQEPNLGKVQKPEKRNLILPCCHVTFV